MAYFHLHAQIIGRSAGRYAVAAGAYRSGSKLHCQRSGLTFDYQKKQDVIRSGLLAPMIVAPPWAPAWVNDRELLYNKIEDGEKRRDAQLLREFDIALPNELDDEAARTLVLKWNRECFLVHHLVSDVAFHSGFQGKNRHVHVLVTLRRIEAGGFSAKKAVELNHPRMCECWREAWERLCNQALESAGAVETITRLSLAAQGIARSPQRHMGQVRTAMHRRGAISDEEWNRSLHKSEVSNAEQQCRPSININDLNTWWAGFKHRLVPKMGTGVQRLDSRPNTNRGPG